MKKWAPTPNFRQNVVRKCFRGTEKKEYFTPATPPLPLKKIKE
jgi:hypothetical protein